jgi:sorting nexin-29
MEKYYEYDKDLYMIFIDFKQAYDSINRNQLWITLEDFGFPSKLVRLIRNCNSNTFYRVRYLGETSTHFEVRNGLRQEAALSSTLFNLALKRVIREMQNSREMEMLGGNTLLAYADDIVIFGESKPELTTSILNLLKK